MTENEKECMRHIMSASEEITAAEDATLNYRDGSEAFRRLQEVKEAINRLLEKESYRDGP